jgi:hypothetical protein
MPSRVRAHEVGLELGDHGQDVEEQSSDRVGWVMDRAAEVELDLAAREVLDDVASVGQRASEAVELVTTRVSPARHAASACRRPGRSRWLPVRP